MSRPQTRHYRKYQTMPTDYTLRPHLRLPGYDYTLAGAYFVTTVTHHRECLFGEICGETMILSPAGKIVHQVWLDLPKHYASIEIGSLIVMPNHTHGIIWMKESQSARPALSEVMRALKSFSARRINMIRKTPGAAVWQREFHDRIIRNDHELERIDAYIRENPRLWNEDQENPFNLNPK